MRNERLVVSATELLEEVWGYDPFSETNTIEVFVSNLRRKLEAGGEPRLLHTIRGAGLRPPRRLSLRPSPPARAASSGRGGACRSAGAGRRLGAADARSSSSPFAVGRRRAHRARLRSDFHDQVGRGRRPPGQRPAPGLRRADRRTTVCSGVALRDFGRAEDAVVQVVFRNGQRVCGNDLRARPRPAARGRSADGPRLPHRVARLVAGQADAPRRAGLALAQLRAARLRPRTRRSTVSGCSSRSACSAAPCALLAGLAIARRAMLPIAALTDAAREIERTRDPGRRSRPRPADDEVAELARTLEDMLAALDAARTETEAALTRQQRFVADASHELRTPLTSVLANLELLARPARRRPAATPPARPCARPAGCAASSATCCCWRAPTPGRRAAPHRAGRPRPGPRRRRRRSSARCRPSTTCSSTPTRPPSSRGDADELHRLALNLIENALRHTPAGTAVRTRHAGRGRHRAAVGRGRRSRRPARAARPRIFDRFVRAAGDARRRRHRPRAWRSSRAVAGSHGGAAELVPARTGDGARFEVRLPLAPAAEREQALAAP